MAIGSSLIAYLLTLLMVVSPLSGDAAMAPKAVDVTLYDLVLTWNDEIYPLEAEVHGRYEATETGSLAEGWLQTAEERLFSLRTMQDADGLILQLDGVDKSLRLGIDSLTGGMYTGYDENDEDAQAQVNAMNEWIDAYQELITVISQKGAAGVQEEFASLNDMIDRGEPEASEALLSDGELVPAEKYAYTITKDDMANLVEAVFSGDGEISTALRRYWGAINTMSDEDIDPAAMVRRSEEDYAIDVTEYEADDLKMAEITFNVSDEDGTVSVTASALERSTMNRVYITIDAYGMQYSIAVESEVGEPDENGVSTFGLLWHIKQSDVDGDHFIISLSVGGEKSGADAIEADLTLYCENDENTAVVTGSLRVDGMDEEIIPPTEDAVGMLDEGMSDVFLAMMTQLSEDGQKLSQIDGFARLMEAMNSNEEYEYEYEDEYEYDDYEEPVVVDTVAEAEELFGASLPLGDTLIGYSLDSIVVSNDYLSAQYTNDDEYSYGLSVEVYHSGSTEELYCRIDEAGALTPETETVYRLLGEDGAYWMIGWAQDDLEFSISFYDGVDLDTASAAVTELHAN